jgi:hypothetical protein
MRLRKLKNKSDDARYRMLDAYGLRLALASRIQNLGSSLGIPLIPSARVVNPPFSPFNLQFIAEAL